jgi:hypothetical protein
MFEEFIFGFARRLRIRCYLGDKRLISFWFFLLIRLLGFLEKIAQRFIILNVFRFLWKSALRDFLDEYGTSWCQSMWNPTQNANIIEEVTKIGLRKNFESSFPTKNQKFHAPFYVYAHQNCKIPMKLMPCLLLFSLGLSITHRSPIIRRCACRNPENSLCQTWVPIKNARVDRTSLEERNPL